MPVRGLNHVEREQLVLADLTASFPSCHLCYPGWLPVAESQDPPDFIRENSNIRSGLEFVEWLDGEQMGRAKTRERQNDALQEILRDGWEKDFRPRHFIRAFVSPNPRHVSQADRTSLRAQFYDCAACVDRSWKADDSYHRPTRYQNQTDFDCYPLLKRYVASIRYIAGAPLGNCWIGVQPGGGAFDPALPGETLKQRLTGKLLDYSSIEKQAHLRSHNLSNLFLLVHGGFNVFFYNTPSGPSLQEIAAASAAFYEQHSLRQIFSEVWFFNSLSSSEEAYRNADSTQGRSRFLAQLWPQLAIVTS